LVETTGFAKGLHAPKAAIDAQDPTEHAHPIGTSGAPIGYATPVVCTVAMLMKIMAIQN
jgi:hypothetical protein